MNWKTVLAVVVAFIIYDMFVKKLLGDLTGSLGLGGSTQK